MMTGKCPFDGKKMEEQVAATAGHADAAIDVAPSSPPPCCRQSSTTSSRPPLLSFPSRRYRSRRPAGLVTSDAVLSLPHALHRHQPIATRRSSCRVPNLAPPLEFTQGEMCNREDAGRPIHDGFDPISFRLTRFPYDLGPGLTWA
ncbi:hypothetical protein Tsubulata_011097 [Turnera subulata]|uniref:Uncharacterized protein n=1 Tax=Turnera subulata TaxID=218843 RepID=A0A9Q0F9V6_9ROSI|nr:hypothetical protein Tsubulata_011097 [Turnera subulata]